MVIAEKLGKTLFEIEQLSIDEYELWVAYFNIQAQAQKKATQKSSRGRRQPIDPRGPSKTMGGKF